MSFSAADLNTLKPSKQKKVKFNVDMNKNASADLVKLLILVRKTTKLPFEIICSTMNKH